MDLKKVTARAELQKREWVEFEFEIDQSGLIQELKWLAFGCHNLIESATNAAKDFKNKKINQIIWQGTNHWDLLINEIISKVHGSFRIPIEDHELCHCRKIPTFVIDQAVVLGAHTPEKVRAWTTATSGCGTCRPDVEKVIQSRIKVAS